MERGSELLKGMLMSRRRALNSLAVSLIQTVLVDYRIIGAIARDSRRTDALHGKVKKKKIEIQCT